jgi:hypothetical protein
MQVREWADNKWAHYWYVSSRDRRRLEEERDRQDQKIKERERLLDEKIAARATGGENGRVQTA